MVDWLNGRVKAYADPEGKIEVKAYWATGDVAMGGTSYEGTLPMAAGVTGVEGLRTIIPIAPVTSAYDYYLANSMFYAPGGYLGEEITNIIMYCFGRGIAGSGTTPSGRTFPSPEVWTHFWGYMRYNLYEQDTDQGDYSPYYDERNIVSFGDDMRKDLGVIMIHGYNDNNVRFKQTALYNEMLKYYGIEVVKGSFSRNTHASSVNSDGALIAESMHEWIDHYLYGIDNGIVDKLPNYSVQSSLNSTWKYYDQWPAGQYKKFYPTGGRVGQLSTAPQTNTTSLSFKDVFQLGLTRPTQANPSAPAFVPNFSENAQLHAGQGTVMAGSQFTRWKNYITGGNDSTVSWTGGGVNMLAPTTLTASWTRALDDRLLFIMDVPEEITISGVIKMTAEIAADKNYGALSAMVLDIGSAPRTTTSTTNSGRSIRLANGNSQALNFHTTATAPYAIVSRGSVDVRNPNPDGKIWPEVPGMDFARTYGGNWNPNYLYQSVEIKPGEFHEYTWELDVMEYTIRAGHKLGVIIYGSDPEYTYLPPNAGAVTEFTANIGPRTYLSLPIIGYEEGPDTREEFEKAVDLIKTLLPAPDADPILAFVIPGDVTADEDIANELEKQIAVITTAHKVGYAPVVRQWIASEGGDGRYYLMPPAGSACEPFWLFGEKIPITSLAIDAPTATTVMRGETYKFGVIINPDSLPDGIVWTVFNDAYATVNPDNSITILNKTGSVLLTATAPSGITASIVLRIM